MEHQRKIAAVLAQAETKAKTLASNLQGLAHALEGLKDAIDQWRADIASKSVAPAERNGGER